MGCGILIPLMKLVKELEMPFVGNAARGQALVYQISLCV